MRIPDAGSAVITQQKLCDYLLNPQHPVGKAKAAWFESLGYTVANWQRLADDLRELARNCDNVIVHPSPYGVKYIAEGQIGIPPCRPGLVVTVWIIEGNSLPRLVTAYPG